MYDSLLGIAACALAAMFTVIGYGAREQADKTYCDLRGSIVLQGVMYECKRKETR